MTIEPKIIKSFVKRNKFLFYDFENVDYNFTYRNYSEMKTIKNFLHRFQFVEKIKNNISSWSYWTIRDKDTPEIIAYKLYGTPHLYWIVLILNEMHDPNWSWPLTDRELYAFVQKKYAYGSERVSSYTMPIGKIYEIVTHANLDFGTIGTLISGTPNTIGARYMITGVAVLGTGDSAKEYIGDANVNTIHHYESGVTSEILALPPGIIVPESYTYSKDDISNLQYERTINENKRKIKLLKPENLESVLSDFRDILSSGFSG